MKTPMTDETHCSTLEYACLLVAFFSIAACSASAVDQVRLEPNEILKFEFPDLPETYFSLSTDKKQPAMLTAQLPANYSRDGKFPLFLYLAAGGGSAGDRAPSHRFIIGPRDYITVDLPLFIKDVSERWLNNIENNWASQIQAISYVVCNTVQLIMN